MKNPKPGKAAAMPPQPKKKKPRKTASAHTPRHPLNPDRLAKIPIEAVSTIAATIRNDSPHESIRKAYELLDVAASAQAFLERSDKQSFEAGIDYHLAITEQKREFEKNLPMIPLEVDSAGNRLNVPWETLVKSLYPDGRQVRLDERETRLKFFISELEGIVDLQKKADRISQLKLEGVAPNLANVVRVCYHDWWEARVSRERAGAARSKGGQGEVKSKSDGRLGSKVKPEDFAEKIGWRP